MASTANQPLNTAAIVAAPAAPEASGSNSQQQLTTPNGASASAEGANNLKNTVAKIKKGLNNIGKNINSVKNKMSAKEAAIPSANSAKVATDEHEQTVSVAVGSPTEEVAETAAAVVTPVAAETAVQQETPEEKEKREALEKELLGGSRRHKRKATRKGRKATRKGRKATRKSNRKASRKGRKANRKSTRK